MAKRKKKSTGGTTRWQAVPNDAIRLAALRWFALTIEKRTIELYATKSSTYHDMEDILRKALHRLDHLRNTLAVGDDDECPEGYIMCGNGVCAPSCDKLTGPGDNS